MSIQLNPGGRAQLVSRANHHGTVRSDLYRLLRGGGAIIYVNVTSVADGDQITSVNVLAELNGSVGTVVPFTGLTFNAVGLYILRIHPGAAGTVGWNKFAQDVMPRSGYLEFISSGGSNMAYEAFLESTPT